MPVETAKVIHQLDDSNPRTTDPKSQGDDHLRLLKTVLQTTFNGYEGVVLVYGSDEGAADAYEVNPDIPVPLYGLGMVVSFEALEANTGPATLDVSGLGALPIVHTTGLPLVAGDIRPGVLTTVQYDGEKFQAIAGSPQLSRVGNQKLTGDFDIAGGVAIGGDVVTGGNLDIDGDFTMPGSATVGGNVNADGNAGFGGDGTFGGNVTANGTGTNDLSRGRTLVRTLEYGAPDSNDAVSVSMLNQASFSSTLPAQEGNGDRFLTTDGEVASWGFAGLRGVRRITSNYTVVRSDKEQIIYGSGALTVTLGTPAQLGSTFGVYLNNIGTSDITVATASGMIDGVSSGRVRPGMCVLILCEGSGFTALRIGPRAVTEMLTSGTSWQVPLGVRMLRVRGVGGGASQGSPSSQANGGGYFEGTFPVSPGSLCPYLIGAGGTPISSPGGTTSITLGSLTLTATGASQTSERPGMGFGGQLNMRGDIAKASAGGGTPLGMGGSIYDPPTGYGSASVNGANGQPGVIILEY